MIALPGNTGNAVLLDGRVGAVLALSLGSILWLANGRTPTAGPNPSLGTGAATLSATVGLILLYVSLMRFRASGWTLDLFVGVAFGTLALGNIFAKLAVPAAGVSLASDTALLLLQYLRLLAAGLFLFSLARREQVVARHLRRHYAVRVMGATIGLVVLGSIAMITAAEALPPAVSQETVERLERGAVIVNALPGQAWWLLLTSGGLALAMLVVVVGYALEARRMPARHLDVLALALALLTIGQFHSLAFPPIDRDYISTDGAFRLAGYLVLLLSLVHQLTHDLVDRAAQEERLSLSRDLHDGLMQQLALLNLRLNRARSADRPEARRALDLDASARVLESAMLEARQVITALRGATVDWAIFARTLDAFADEFSRNHEVAVEVRTSSTQVSIEAALQADVLRIAHEACSNAVRHGEAMHVWIEAAIMHGWLELQVSDDGRGFAARSSESGHDSNPPGSQSGRHPAREQALQGGVGLRSMEERARSRRGTLQIDSAPGQGTTVRVRMPVGVRDDGTPE